MKQQSKNINTNKKLIEQYILFIGTESDDISNAIKLMCNAETLKQTTTVRLVNKTEEQTNTFIKPISYADLQLESGENIHLIEINQILQMNLLKRFWSNRELGFILLVDLNSENAIDEMENTLSKFSSYLKKSSLSVGVINNDNVTNNNLNSVNNRLKLLKYKVAAFDVNTNSYSDVSILIQSMLIQSMLNQSALNQSSLPSNA